MSQARPLLRYLLIALLLLTVSLPWLVSDGVRHWLSHELRQQGLQQVTFERLWINPYTARLEVEGMVWQREQQSFELQRLQADLSWLDMLSRTLRLEALLIEGLDVDIQQQQGRWVINGLPLPDAQANDDATQDDTDTQAVTSSDEPIWHIAVDGIDVRDVRVVLNTDALSVRSDIEEVKLQPFHTGLTDESELNLVINVQQVAVPAAKLKVSSRLNYTALLDLQRGEAGGWQSLILGNASLENTQLTTETHQSSTLLAEVSRTEIGITSELEFTESLMHHSNVEVNVSEAVLRHDQQLLMDFYGFSLNSAFDGERLSINNLVLSGLNLLPVTRSVATEAESAENATGGESLGRGKVATVATRPFVEEAYAYLDQALVKLPTESAPLSVDVDQLTLGIADIHLQRNADGTIAQLQQWQALQSALLPPEAQDSSSTSSQHTSETAEAAPQILLKNLSVESEVAFHFYDSSVEPAFNETLQMDYLDVKNINLTQPMSIAFNSHLSHDANLSGEATLNPSDLSGEGKLQLRQYELLSISPYGQYFTGYALEAGQLSVSSKFAIASNVLKSDTAVDIDQLHLRSEHSDVSDRFAHKLTMPLDQAMDLLRDGNNRIHLQVPVNGELNNPDVQLGQVINTAMRGAMKKASMAMLTTLLQPYGTVLSIAQMAGEEMTRVRLAPMPFAPGEAVLNTEALAYANKVGLLIRERPSLKVRLCGMTSEVDRQALQQHAQQQAAAQEKSLTPEALAASAAPAVLKDLGKRRSEVLKAYLQSQGQVSTQQLFMCLPKHVNNAKPGVALSI